MSDDAYEWECQNTFPVQVIAGVYVFGQNAEGQPEITCGFFEDEHHQLSLPTMNVTDEHHAAEVAIHLFQHLIKVDPRTLDITPFGFFDPIRPPLDDSLKANRTIYLGYKTAIHPGTPVHKDLRFMDYEELEIASARIARGHYTAYRTGVSC